MKARVEVRGKTLTYNVPDTAQVGDVVAVPRPAFLRGVNGEYGPLDGIVVALDSDYEGPLVAVRFK